MKLPNINLNKVNLKYTSLYVIISAIIFGGLHLFTDFSIYENNQFFGYFIIGLVLILGMEVLKSIKTE